MDSIVNLNALLFTKLRRVARLSKEKAPGGKRSIIEVHNGQLRIESELNAGTNVEVGLPTL